MERQQTTLVRTLNSYVYGNSSQRKKAVSKLSMDAASLSPKQTAQVVSAVKTVQDKFGVLLVSKLLNAIVQEDAVDETKRMEVALVFGEVIELLSELTDQKPADKLVELKVVLEHLVLTLLRHKRFCADHDKVKLKRVVMSKGVIIESMAVVRAMLKVEEWGVEMAAKLDKWWVVLLVAMFPMDIECVSCMCLVSFHHGCSMERSGLTRR